MRVELNGFSPAEFIEMLREGIERHLGDTKLIPADDQVLANAYRELSIRSETSQTGKRIAGNGAPPDLPDMAKLRSYIRDGLQDDLDLSWDAVMLDLIDGE